KPQWIWRPCCASPNGSPKLRTPSPTPFGSTSRRATQSPPKRRETRCEHERSENASGSVAPVREQRRARAPAVVPEPAHRVNDFVGSSNTWTKQFAPHSIASELREYEVKGSRREPLCGGS